MALRISSLGKSSTTSPTLQLRGFPSDYRHYLGSFAMDATREGTADLKLVWLFSKGTRTKCFLLLHTHCKDSLNYCQVAPSRSTLFCLKAPNRSLQLPTLLPYSNIHHYKQLKGWHYVWFSNFLEDFQLFHSAATEEYFYKNPIETRKVGLVWGLEDIPSHCSAWRRLML